MDPRDLLYYAFWFSALSFILIVFTLVFIIRILNRMRDLANAEILREQQRQLARVELQISEWLGHDHVKRDEFGEQLRTTASNTNRLTRIEALMGRSEVDTK